MASTDPAAALQPTWTHGVRPRKRRDATPPRLSRLFRHPRPWPPGSRRSPNGFGRQCRLAARCFHERIIGSLLTLVQTAAAPRERAPGRTATAQGAVTNRNFGRSKGAVEESGLSSEPATPTSGDVETKDANRPLIRLAVSWPTAKAAVGSVASTEDGEAVMMLPSLLAPPVHLAMHAREYQAEPVHTQLRGEAQVLRLHEEVSAASPTCRETIGPRGVRPR
ncbi:uncharacterized protein LOC144166296 [Haemaphysalis longicornis]